MEEVCIGNQAHLDVFRRNSGNLNEIMKKEILLRLNEIKKRMHCNKGFLCAASGYENLCRARDIGLRRHLLCRETAPGTCDFSLLLDENYYCACPLRVYLTKKLSRIKAVGAEAI